MELHPCLTYKSVEVDDAPTSTSSASRYGKEDRLKALPAIKTIETQRGRRYTQTPAGQEAAGKEWTRLVIEAEALRHGVARLGGQGHFASYVAGWCDGHQSSRRWHFCKAGGHNSGLHSADAQIMCRDMFGNTCQKHLCETLSRGVMTLHKQRTGQMPWKWIEKHDEGLASDGTAPLTAANLSRLQTIPLLPVLECDTNAVATIIRDSSLAASTKIDRFVKQVQSVALFGLTTSPSPAVNLDIATIMRRLSASVDQTRQFNCAGERIGHTIGSCRLVPAWVQGTKKSGSMYVVMLWLTAVHAMQCETPQAQAIVRQVERLLDTFTSVERQYRKSGGNPLAATSLPAAAEAEALVLAARCPERTPALSKALHEPSPELADIDSLIDGYAQASSFPEASEALAPLVKQSKEILRADLASIEHSEKVRKAAKQTADHADAVEVKMRGKRLERNADGVPTFGFPKETPSPKIFKLALVACVRCWTACDWYTLCTTVFVMYMEGWFVNVVKMWIEQWIEHGGRDALSGLRQDTDHSGPPSSRITQKAYPYSTLLGNRATRASSRG